MTTGVSSPVPAKPPAATQHAPASVTPRARRFALLIVLGFLLLWPVVHWVDTAAPETDLRTFPASWNLGLRAPIDEFQSWVIRNRTTHPVFAYFFTPLSQGIDNLVRGLEAVLGALPWPSLVALAAFAGWWSGGRNLAFFGALALLFVGALGLWDAAILTMALMAASVAIALTIGYPLGIAAAKSPRFYTFLRPLLDAMQTMPAFVYLIPVLLFFGVARAPSVIATVIYALPPIVRLTAAGIREASPAAKEAADAFGASAWQKLRKVEIPLAMPSIRAGVNQTIMMALGMVVIAALIGAGGLGREVLVALQRLRVGQGLEAGLAIVIIAILLDRLTQSRDARTQNAERRPAMFNQVPPLLFAYVYWSAAAMVVLYFWVVDAYVVGLREFPAGLQFSIREPVDEGVRWMRDNLYRIGGLPIGTGPFSDFLIVWLLNPLRSLLQSWLPWPLVVLAFGVAGYLSAGWRLGLLGMAGILLTGLLGMWAHTMDTLSQVLVAVAVALVIGLPLGVWSAWDDRVRATLRPILDFLQTIPVFVYLVPVIMLFHVGRTPGIIASVLYAVPPVIRLTDLGIRRVGVEITEAADAFGATRLQRLFKVQLPLALPTLMLGVNQTVMMVLAMVIIAGLVGGGALGFEAVNGLARNEVGRGVEAGIAIVCLAIVLDRITQAWAKPRRGQETQ